MGFLHEKANFLESIQSVLVCIHYKGPNSMQSGSKKSQQNHNLSRYLSRDGIASESPLRALISPIIFPALEVGSIGSSGKTAQWSNTHCGNAWPPVADLKAAVKPESRENNCNHQSYHIPTGKSTANSTS